MHSPGLVETVYLTTYSETRLTYHPPWRLIGRFANFPVSIGDEKKGDGPVISDDQWEALCRAGEFLEQQNVFNPSESHDPIDCLSHICQRF